MPKLTIVISGKEGSGKKSLIKLIVAEFLNKKIGTARFSVEKYGKDVFIIDNLNNMQALNPFSKKIEVLNLYKAHCLALYDFDDPLKEFCVNTFGLDRDRCFGDEDDREILTNIMWDSFPKEVREKYSKKRRGKRGGKLAIGPMKICEVINVFGGEVCRGIDPNCWARNIYNIVNKDTSELIIINNAKYMNDITIGTENNAKVIRLLKNKSILENQVDNNLDDLPLGEYSLVVNNENMQVKDMWQYVYPFIVRWFERAQIA